MLKLLEFVGLLLALLRELSFDVPLQPESRIGYGRHNEKTNDSPTVVPMNRDCV